MKQPWDDKLVALRKARRSKGLCMKCGEPYSPQHRCPKQIQLHVLEELLEILQLDNQEGTSTDVDSNDSEEELLTLSQCASEGIQGKKTIRLPGFLQNQEILVLVDSGSSSTFVKDTLVHQLKLATT